jgi:hypothetical protein
MGKPTPETGGGTPHNHGLSEFKPLSKERRVGWGVKKAEEPKQQPADSRWESYDRFFRKGPMHPAVFEGLPPTRPSRQSKDKDNQLVTDQRPMGTRTPESLPGGNAPGESEWQLISPKDRSKVQAFMRDLTENKEKLRHQMQYYLQKPDITMDDVIWRNYLNLSLNRLVFDIEPLTGKSRQERVINHYLANIDAQHVAELWLDQHPTSEAAKIIAERGVAAPAIIHAAFLFETWPSFGVKIDKVQ